MESESDGGIEGTMTLLGDQPLSAATQLASCVGHAATAQLTRITERDPTLWVFGARGGDGFADNSKYLFLHVCAHHPEIRAVWLAANPSVVEVLQAHGYEAYRTYSSRGLDLNRRAGVTFLTHGFGDVCMSLSGGALSVMLWHGTPLKNISWDAAFREKPRAVRAAAAYAYRRLDLLTAASEAVSETFVTGFRVDPDVIHATGYPRNDVLVGELSDDELSGAWIGVDSEVRKKVETLSREGQVWLYLPTFRQIGGTSGISDHVDFAVLDTFLAERDATLLVKAHPFERLALDEELERIVNLPASTDVYPLLRSTDGLLTDYSSILFDFLLCDRPIVLYPYDLDTYRAERGFYYDFSTISPGPVATDFEELLGALDRAMTARARGDERERNRDSERSGIDGDSDDDTDPYASKRARLRERFCQVGENRSEAVCNLVFEHLD